MPTKPTQGKKAPKAETYPVEQWVYMGRRIDSTGTLLHAYRDADGETLLFKDKHRVVGALYELEVKRDDKGGAKARLADAKFVEADAVSDGEAQEWIVADRGALSADELRKVEARAKKDTQVWESMTLAELHEAYTRLPGMQKTGMMAYVMRYLNQGI